MGIGAQTRRILRYYLKGWLTLREFHEWFVPATWDVYLLEYPDRREVIDLVYGIELRLAEYTSGCWTEEQLRELLRPFVEKVST